MKRRELFTRGAASIALCATPAAPVLASVTDDQKAVLMGLIEDLEAVHGWQAVDLLACKHFAAYRIRQALGLDLPEQTRARDHCYIMQRSFEDYQRSVWYGRKIAAGETPALSDFERAL